MQQCDDIRGLTTTALSSIYGSCQGNSLSLEVLQKCASATARAELVVEVFGAPSSSVEVAELVSAVACHVITTWPTSSVRQRELTPYQRSC